MENTIRSCYAKLGNHRAVAHKLGLPLHYVMYVLGLMDEKLFAKVNKGA